MIPLSSFSLCTALLAAGCLASALPAQTLFQSAFDDTAPGAVPAGWSGNHVAGADPVNPANLVFRTGENAATTTRTHYSLGTAQTAAGGISLSLDFYMGDGGASWQTSWFLQTGALASSQFYTAGYGFTLRASSVDLYLTSGGGVSTNQGTATSLATATLPGNLYVTQGWNSLVFTWQAGGALELRVNGSIVATATDPAAADATSFSFRTLKASNYRSDAANTLYFDNLSVAVIPEASSTGLLLAGLASVALAGTILVRRGRAPR